MLSASTRVRRLIEYLADHYVVDIEAVPDLAAAFPHPPTDAQRVVRLTSTPPDAAAVTVAFTATGIAVHVGALHDLEYPDRRGDAWKQIVDVVLAAAAGAFREAYPIGRRRFAGYAIGTRDGHFEGGRGPVTEIDPALLRAAEARLAQLPEGWAPWTLRQDAA